MSHQLALEIPPIANPKVLRVYDSSVWDTALPVTARKLDVIPPGYTESATFSLTAGFDRLLNASNLGISVTTDPSTLSNLPDGVWIVRLTVENGSTSQWVEYNHLRQVCLLRDYYKALCTLNFYPCDTLDVDLEAKRKELQIIKSYIDAAKAKVEWCNAPVEGMELYKYAQKLLANFSLEKCKTC
jgi:hypothetical protein